MYIYIHIYQQITFIYTSLYMQERARGDMSYQIDTFLPLLYNKSLLAVGRRSAQPKFVEKSYARALRSPGKPLWTLKNEITDHLFSCSIRVAPYSMQ